jgi:hypothetical protein
MAALVFAALVPMFINASKASAGDKTRNIAMQVAQGRIDSIQLLSWSQLTDPNVETNLQSSTFAGGLFGSSYSPPGSTAEYHISYKVTPKPSADTPSYVQVQVEVTTPALKGSPSYTTRMTTIILNPSAASSTATASPTPSPSATPAPTVSSFTPASGPAGTGVTVTGSGFLSATAVRFNGVAATFKVVSDTQITSAVPQGATTGAISVTNPSGTGASASSFTVTVPTSGPYSLTVMVTGGNWVNPTTGVTVVQTNVIPNFTHTPSPQFPTTTSNAVWSGLPAGTFYVTCNYYMNGRHNKSKSVSQTVAIINANQQLSFDLTK